MRNGNARFIVKGIITLQRLDRGVFQGKRSVQSPLICVHEIKAQQTIKRAGTNKHKGKKFSTPFQRWQGSRGRRHLVALAAVVNYVYLRNPFVCGKNNQTDSGQIRKSIKPPAPKIQSLTNDNNISNKLKTLLCRRLETERCSVRNGDFSFRR